MSECNHDSPKSLESLGHPFGRCSSESVFISNCSITGFITRTLPNARDNAGMPCVKWALICASESTELVIETGNGLNTVFVANTKRSVTAFASSEDQERIPRKPLLNPQPDQFVVPIRARNPARPFHSSCFCQEYRAPKAPDDQSPSDHPGLSPRHKGSAPHHRSNTY